MNNEAVNSISNAQLKHGAYCTTSFCGWFTASERRNTVETEAMGHTTSTGHEILFYEVPKKLMVSRIPSAKIDTVVYDDGTQSRELTVKLNVIRVEYEQALLDSPTFIGNCELCGASFDRSRFTIVCVFGGKTHTAQTCEQCTTMAFRRASGVRN